MALYRKAIIIHELCYAESAAKPLKLLIDLLIRHFERLLSDWPNAIKHLFRIFTRLLEA